MNKNYIYISLGVIVVIVGVGIILFSGNDNIINNSSVNNLYPEQSISHGHGLAVDVANPSKLWIATHYGLLLLENEKDLYRIGKSQDDFMGFSVHPTDSNIFFTSGHSSLGGNLGFQRSDDSGVTWQKVSNGVGGPVDFHAMAVSPINTNIIYGWYAGNLQRSENQGENWEIVNREIAPMQLVADSEIENRVYAATRNGVLLSDDKGVTWTTLSPEIANGAVFSIAVHPQDAQILLVFSEALSGLGKSTNNGQTWSKINEQFGNEAVLHIAFSRIDPNIVYVLTHENTLYKSNDIGDTWIQVR